MKTGVEKTDNELIAEFMGGSPFGNGGSVGKMWRFEEDDFDADELAYQSNP